MFSAFTFSLGAFFIFCTQFCYANYPLLDVDTNMRIVLVPHDAPVGSIIYRLRASDSDHHFPLKFELLGIVGQTLLEIQDLGCSKLDSLCQADVLLKKALDLGRTYEFQIRVTDTTGDFTKVKAVISSTHGSVFTQNMLCGRILHIPENTPVGNELETFTVAKNDLNTRPVLLEIREPKGRIELKQKLLSNNRTEGILRLKKELDFEKEPWFTFQLLALNAHTNSSVDTRNVLVSEMAVLIEDVQDSPPFFTSLIPSIELSNSLKPGDLITQVKAEDGDKENQRLIRYGLLTELNPFVAFFDLNSMTGEIRLRRNISELFFMVKPNEPIAISIIAEEISSEYSKLARLSAQGPTSVIANVTFWYRTDVAFGPPVFSSDKYYGEIEENSPVGTPVRFSLDTKVSVSNADTMIELDFSNSNQNHVFTVSPRMGRGNFSFVILVSDSSLLDYERTQLFKLTLKASTSSGLFSIVPVEIQVRDLNDNSPTFSQNEYVVEINELAPFGTKVMQVNATDRDSGLFGQVVYSNLVGSNSFRIDPESGTIFVQNSLDLDRESQPEIRLYVEVKDGGFTESSDPNFVRNVQTGTVTVKLRDVNEAPVCESKFYQAILTPDLDGLKWPVYVKAIDTDSVGPNSEIRYQIVGESRFSIDPTTGQIHLKYPIRFSPRDLASVFLGSFKVRAYDLGNPQMSTECTVQLYSEDVVSQEIGFVFPSPADALNRDRERVERMLSQFTGGHTSIINISPFDSSKANQQPPQLIEKRFLGPESRMAAISDERTGLGTGGVPEASSSSDQSVVLVSVQSPLSTRTRLVDLGSLRDFMISDQTVSPTSSPGAHTGVTASESNTLFWLLIALIILLLLLFLLFLCCLFCPCCYLFRNGKRTEKIEKHTERVVEAREPLPRRSRKTYPVQIIESAEDPGYNGSYRTREAWSGDNRQWRGSVPARRGAAGGRHRSTQAEAIGQREAEDVVVEDWEFADYQAGQSRAEDIGARWQMMQQQQERYPADHQRRRVAYAGQRHPGDEDFVRQPVVSYLHLEEARGQRHPKQRSPARSLPPVASANLHVESAREPQTRFYKTTDAEVLELDYDGDGDEGKELLMRRFISEQHPQEETPTSQFEEPLRGPSRRRQLTPAGESSLKVHVGGIVEGFDEEEFQSDQVTLERPKAASFLRRQNGIVESQGTFAREIDKIDEEEEPNATKKERGHKAANTSKSHHKKHRDKEKEKHEKKRSKRRSTSEESRKSAKGEASRSKSPAIPEDRQKPKRDIEPNSRSHSRSSSPSKSKVEEKARRDISRSRAGSSLGLPEIEVPAQQGESSLITESSRETKPRQAPEAIAIEVISPSTVKNSLKDEPPSHPEPRSASPPPPVDSAAQHDTELPWEEDEDSGIGLIGIANKKSKMLEKKSVFDIAYDEMVTQNVLRPDTAHNQPELDFN